MIIHDSNTTTTKGTVDDEDQFDKLAQVCTIQGTVMVGSYPKWRQKGQDELVSMRERYFCIRLNEANVFGDLNDGGEAEVWCDVTWAGITKTSRKFKKANVNQTLLFKIPIPPDQRKNQDKLEKFLTKELQSKSEFEITVWADTYKMNYDNMGGGKLCLSGIASPKVKYED
jgi:hypothetical protein